ncbi:hypothetical protein [Microbacterium sp. LWH10-1.2]|uniref:hypothetical protein n=1 Tax=Microbacterium sp. LWH10-1.2 TaxID=3135255 RepID=UPI003139D190
MTKRVAVAAVLALGLILTGCGSPAEEEPTGVELCIQDYLNVNTGAEKVEAIQACGDALNADPDKFLEVYGE